MRAREGWRVSEHSSNHADVGDGQSSGWRPDADRVLYSEHRANTIANGHRFGRTFANGFSNQHSRQCPAHGNTYAANRGCAGSDIDSCGHHHPVTRANLYR